MRRMIGITVAALTAAAMIATPAAAHHIHVDPPGAADGHEGWVGSPAEGIPGQGEGLIQGGPTGETTLSPSHDKGLVQACVSIREQDQAAVDIHGPGPPGWDECTHFSP